MEFLGERVFMVFGKLTGNSRAHSKGRAQVIYTPGNSMSVFYNGIRCMLVNLRRSQKLLTPPHGSHEPPVTIGALSPLKAMASADRLYAWFPWAFPAPTAA